MSDIDEVSKTLEVLTPGKRLKFIRQKIIKQKQSEFCEDGIVRIGTLKAIESESIKISKKVSEKVIAKLRVEGIVCDESLFLDAGAKCDISVNPKVMHTANHYRKDIEKIRESLTYLTPFKIENEHYEPLVKKGSIIMGNNIPSNEIIDLNHTLCLIKGEDISLWYLTYRNRMIHGEINSVKKTFTKETFDLCPVYKINLIYIN